MRIKRITKLSIWTQLQNKGFKPVRFRAHGKIQGIGAYLPDHHGSDKIVIEPKYFRADGIYKNDHWSVACKGTITYCHGRYLLKTVLTLID